MLMLKMIHSFSDAAAQPMCRAYANAALPPVLAKAAVASAGDLFHRLCSSDEGLNREAIALSRQDFGRNVLSSACEGRLRRRLGRMALILQSRFGQSPAGYLKRLKNSQVRVLRSGSEHIVPATELVPGDVVRISAGDMVPADIRILSCGDFSIDETALAGSRTISKKTAGRAFTASVAAEARNLAFAGTVVEGGSATGIVVATGERTLLSAAEVTGRVPSAQPQLQGALA